MHWKFLWKELRFLHLEHYVIAQSLDWKSNVWESVCVEEKTQDGLLLKALLFFKKKSISQRMLLVTHGYGEHGGRYIHFPKALEKAYDLILIPDLRGHGRSEGKRGDLEHFDQFLKDIRLWVEALYTKVIFEKDFSKNQKDRNHLEKHKNNSYLKKSLDIFGHSLGGLLVLRFLKESLPYQDFFRSVLLSAPLLKLALPVPFWKDALAQVLLRVAPHVAITTGKDPALLTHDPDILGALEKDLWMHDLMTSSFYFEMKRVMEEVRGQNLNTEIPMHFFVPLADQVVHTGTIIDFFKKKCKSPKKTLKTYSGFYHESFQELEKAQCFQDWILWLQTL